MTTGTFASARDRARLAMLDAVVGEYPGGAAITLRHILINRIPISPAQADDVVCSLSVAYDREMLAEWQRLYEPPMRWQRRRDAIAVLRALWTDLLRPWLAVTGLAFLFLLVTGHIQ